MGVSIQVLPKHEKVRKVRFYWYKMLFGFVSLSTRGAKKFLWRFAKIQSFFLFTLAFRIVNVCTVVLFREFYGLFRQRFQNQTFGRLLWWWNMLSLKCIFITQRLMFLVFFDLLWNVQSPIQWLESLRLILILWRA